MDIKAYQDGDDFVLVFKNCTVNTKKILETLLNPSMFSDSNMEMEGNMDAYADVLVGFGPYKSMTAADVLSQEKDKGYANLAYLVQNKKLAAEAASAVKDALNQYLSDRFSGLDAEVFVKNTGEEDIRTFASYFSLYLSKSQKEDIAEQAGYENFEEFLKTSSKRALQSFAMTLIEKIKKDMH